MNPPQEKKNKDVHYNFTCINNKKRIGNDLNARHKRTAKKCGISML